MLHLHKVYQEAHVFHLSTQESYHLSAVDEYCTELPSTQTQT